MSTIIAVQKDGQLAVAWDTQTNTGPTKVVNKVGLPKVNKIGDSYVGIAGYTVYGNLLGHYVRHTKDLSLTMRNEDEVFEFFILFWKAIQEDYHLVNNSWDQDDPSPFADLDAEFLITNAEGIFLVRDNLSVNRFERYCVIGSGSPHAEGAAEAMYDSTANAESIARRCVEIAGMFDASTGGDTQSLCVK